MIDLVIYDEHQVWSPSINAAGRNGAGVGGWEVMCTQLAHGMATRGLSVWCLTPGETSERVEDGVTYAPLHTKLQTRALITGRHSSIPANVTARRTYTACVDDPSENAHHYAHLVGRTTMVHLSEWQQSLYKRLGHADGFVIPSMISDWIYDMPPQPKRWYVCVSAWNKGTDATLQLWNQLGRPGTLSVGSPYGAPRDAYERCAAAGARWLGQLTPKQVVMALARAAAVFRVCERPETFGVTDAIAEVVGTRVHALYTNGMGAAREALSSPYLTESVDEFWAQMAVEHDLKVIPKANFRQSHLLERWGQELGR